MRRSAGLVSTKCTSSAARNAGTTLAARSASAIRVPRPGPSSTRWSAAGAPIACQTAAAHRPINSPNIWLLSRAATKSPARPKGAAPHHEPQDDDEREPFEPRLVKLARMARHRPAARKHHRPRHVARAAPQLAIDEIGETPEEQPDRPDRADHVAEREHRDIAAARKQHDRDHAAEKAAVERHAALPNIENLERVRREVREIVEQHIAGAPAEDDPEGDPQDEVVELAGFDRRRSGPGALGAQDRAAVR